MNQRIWIVSVGLVLGLLACRKTLDRPQWDVDAYIPLARTELRLQNALEDSLLSTNSDSSLQFVFNGNLFSFEIDSLFEIPDTTTEEFLELPFGSVTFNPGEDIVNDTQDTKYDLEGIELQEALVRSGGIEIELTSSIAEDIVFTYSLPYASLNGVPFTVTEFIPAGSITNPTSLSRSYDLAGYDLNLRGIEQNSFNTLTVLYRATVDPNGSPVTIVPGDYVRVRNTLTQIIPDYARGYFGNRIETQAEEELLDLFKNLPEGEANLSQASLTFSVENSVGADVRVLLRSLESVNTQTGITVPLSASLIGDNINLNRASETGIPAAPIQPTVFVTEIDSATSNVTDFVSNLPDRLRYDVEFELNPLGNASNGNDFIYYETGIQVDLDAQVPLLFSARNLVLVDTTELDVDTDSREEAEKINGGQLLLHAYNYYPIDAFVQIYWLDESFTVIDSLFTEPEFVPSGMLNADRRVREPTFALFSIPLTPPRIDRLYEADYALIQARMSTVNYPEPLQFFSDYRIDLKLVGDFSYRVDLPEE